MDPDGDNQPVAQDNSVPDHIQMAIGDGVEGAGIQRDAGHEPRLPRPGRPRKPGWFSIDWQIAAHLFKPSSEPLRDEPGLLGKPTVFRPA